ncbi:MAG: carbohydrate kinase [SAR324 cluster bacterium]|nr:carbohydrate kinase [SAR324 cluster bacterium]
MSRILCFGEVLFDVYPEYQRLGGAPLNFAYHLHQLQQTVAFVSRIGDDENGNAVLQQLSSHQFPTDMIQTDPQHPTGTVQVTLDEQAVPSFDIVEDVAYDHIQKNTKVDQFLQEGIDLFYVGTLAQRGAVSQQTVKQILALIPPSASVFYDINLRPPFYTMEIIEQTLQKSTIVKLNKDEFDILKKNFAAKGEEVDAAQQLMERFDVDLCITKGGQGGVYYSLSRSSGCSYQVTPASDVVDTVGAGDGFAAMLCYGILQKQPMEEVLGRASRFAVEVCRVSGALPEVAIYSHYS